MKKYIYLMNYPTNEKELALLEKRILFKSELEDKVFLSEKNIDPTDSPFLKAKIEIIYSSENFQDIINSIESEKIVVEDFKVEYMRLEKDNIPYEERLEKVKAIGLKIIGTPNMQKPTTLYGITFFENRWYFGKYSKNSFLWQNHIDKPKSYSNSIGVKTSKAVLNIATGGDKSLKIMDSCAGVGTIVLEGLFMGLHIKGCEINSIIAQDGNENLEHYGYNSLIKNDDMHNIKEHYDVTILDIPYGIFSHITIEEQKNLIKKCYEISDKMVLISFEELEYMVLEAGFKIKDFCTVPKGQFKRHIYLCEK